MKSHFGHTQSSFRFACNFFFTCNLHVSMTAPFGRVENSVTQYFVCIHSKLEVSRVTNENDFDEISRIVTYNEVQYFSILVHC